MYFVALTRCTNRDQSTLLLTTVLAFAKHLKITGKIPTLKALASIYNFNKP